MGQLELFANPASRAPVRPAPCSRAYECDYGFRPHQHCICGTACRPGARRCRYCLIEEGGHRLTDSTPGHVFWDGAIEMLHLAMSLPLTSALA